jgi:hypothetical protein
MNRSTFIKTFALGAVATPAIAAFVPDKKEPAAIRRPGFKLLGVLPPEAGPVASMISYEKRIFVACQNGVYYFDPETLK